MSPAGLKATTRKLIKMSYYIPFEIQAEIMKRLPVKSLIQFKSVSKQWKSFIHSSKFIADHCDYREKHALVVDDDMPRVPRCHYLSKLGCSKGLFCLYLCTPHRTMDIAVIWNPSIRKSVDIVLASKLNWRRHHIVVGFGVCPRTFDPVLVKITYTKNKLRQAHVFRLSSGAWKSLSSINLPRESISFKQRNNSIDLDGFIYWHAEDEVKSHNLIMSFDMISETFVEISLPDSLVDAESTHVSISKRMESLVVLEYKLWTQKQVYHVWMMEGGVCKSFTKLFTIEAPEASITMVLGFRKSGEPIIAMDDNIHSPGLVKLYLYEPNSRDISYVDIGMFERNFRLASSYTDTLLLLGR